MNRVRLKLFVAGSIVAVAVTLLAIAGMREGWVYYLPVDQFIGNDTYKTQRVRLHGKVGEENFDSNRALLLANFDLHGDTQTIRVEYNGVIPDMFQVGRDVVVEGRLDETGVFQADTLLTKCASKYETADGQAPHADPHASQVDRRSASESQVDRRSASESQVDRRSASEPQVDRRSASDRTTRSVVPPNVVPPQTPLPSSESESEK